MKILFVDDDTYFMQAYVDAFSARPDNMDVVKVNSASEAIKLITANTGENKFDCLVLDVMMPPPEGWEARTENGKFTGLELVKEHQADVAAVELPVLILSNLGSETVTPRVAALKLTRGMFIIRSKNSTPPRDAKAIILELIALRKKRLSSLGYSLSS